MTKTILTVDDSRTMRDMLHLALTEAGFRVVQAVDGLDGLEALDAAQADVIITDINMPRLDGFGFIEGVPRQVVFCAMEVQPDAWPEVLVEIDAPTAVPLSLITPGDSREIGCGVLSLMVCRADDFAARLDYLEQRSLHSFARV